MTKGPNQIVKVQPVIESERVMGQKPQRPKMFAEKAPMRCQLWDYRRLVGVVPVTFDDFGHPTDVTFNPTHVEKVTRIAFIFGNRTYAHPLPEPVMISPGNPLHLALGGMNLRDKFGKLVLGAGTG